MRIPGTLAERTTLRVGGPVGRWIIAETEQQAVDAVREADAAGTPVLILGGGSNLVASDAGFPGVVVELATTGRAVSVEGARVVVTAEGGETWDDVVALAVDEGWSGIEALAGIPGRVGATPIQNVGAYGQDVGQVIESVRALDRSSGRVERLDRDRCAFGYRSSAFKSEPSRWLLLSVTLCLRAGRQGTVRYAELARTLGVPVGASVDVGDIRAAVLLLRGRKGMVLDPTDHDTWSAGSFFTNPIVDAAVASRVPEGCPRYPSESGVKLSAAWLIENAGISKGFALRPDAPAAISSRHTLALTNRGSATARDVMELAREVQRRVLAAHGIELSIEPTLVGEPG